MPPLHHLNLLRSFCCIESVLTKNLPNKLKFIPFTSHVPVRFAGHSHWKNVKHIKEAKDAEKQKVTLGVLQRMRVAVRGKHFIVCMLVCKAVHVQT
jgi:hypothetical protein